MYDDNYECMSQFPKLWKIHFVSSIFIGIIYVNVGSFLLKNKW